MTFSAFEHGYYSSRFYGLPVPVALGMGACALVLIALSWIAVVTAIRMEQQAKIDASPKDAVNVAGTIEHHVTLLVRGADAIVSPTRNQLQREPLEAATA